MGIRGVQGGVRGCSDGTPHGTLTKKKFVSPTMVSGWGWGGPNRG